MSVGIESVEPESVGLSKTRLERIAQHLDSKYVAPGKIAGCLTLVARKGKVAYLQAQGSMDRERDRPMVEDTLFRIYSMSKPVTSVALMSLYEEAAFDLSTPVSKFIPAFKNLRVYAQGTHPNFVTTRPEREMNVKDLLTHTSGLTYGFMYRTNVDHGYRRIGLDLQDHRESTLEEFVDKVAQMPLEFSPGSAWNYSVSTDVCGRLVEVISGKPLDVFLRERIFDPLGMPDTAFEVPEAEPPALRRQLPAQSQEAAGARRRSHGQPLPQRHDVLGRRRPRIDCPRLQPLLPDAAERR